MDEPRRVLSAEAYSLPRLGSLPTPRLLVYRHLLDANIASMRRLLGTVGCGWEALRPHVKTHKSAWVTQRLLGCGVTRFKCTPNELDMLVEAGARDIFVAYPLLPREADRVASLARRHRDLRLWTQLGSIEHAEILAEAAERHGVSLDSLLDIDVGNHRTGAPAAAAVDIATAVAGSKRLASVRLRGLHAYDGHNNSPDPAARAECARGAMRDVAGAQRALEKRGVPIERIVVGGSPGFLPCLRELREVQRVPVEVEASPGTWVYWDTNYDRLLPGTFALAALVLAQVMDRPAADLITLNLGHKRWAIDQGPVEVFSRTGLEVLRTSEEHTVLRHPAGEHYAIGEPILIAPRHVCSTVNLWEEFSLIGPGGEIEESQLPVTARNR